MKKTIEDFEIIINECKELGIEAKLIPHYKKTILKVSKGEIEYYFNYRFDISSTYSSARILTHDKHLTNTLLSQANLSVPKFSSYYTSKKLTPESLLSDLKSKSFSYPVVVKDVEGSLSKDVITGVKNDSELLNAVVEISKNIRDIMIQEMVYGSEYRVMVLGDRCIGVLKMDPPSVRGNGTSTVEELITALNTTNEKPIEINNEVLETLRSQGIGLTDKPESEKKIYLLSKSSLARGGKTIDMTQEIHPSIVAECVKAAKAVKRTFAGIDLLCEDISKPISEQSLNFIEVNSRPDIYIHHFPDIGTPQNVSHEILKYIFSM